MARKKVEKAVSTKPVNEGEIVAGIPKTLMLTAGDQGATRGNSLGYRVTSKQLYTLRKRHPYLAAVHNAIIKQVKKVELQVVPIDAKKAVNEIAKAKMEAFAKNGFGQFGEKEFRGRMVDTKKWNGDAFAEIVFSADVNHEPILIQYIYAETMRILPDEHGIISGYPQVVDGELNVVFPPDNVMHLKEHDDEYSFFGFSDIESLFGTLLLDVLADEHSTAKLENDAMPAGILTFPENDDETTLLRMRAFYITQLRQNPNKPVFLNKNVQWIPMGAVGMKDIDYQELHRSAKERIMMVYSVLPMQVAVVETGKLANPEQQLEIGEEYIRQELEVIQSAYNQKLTSRFKDTENLMFKFGDLDPKLDSIQKQATIDKTKAELAKLLSSIPGAFTVNEIREASGHEKLLTGGEEIVQQPEPQFGPVGLAEEGISEKEIETKALEIHKAGISKGKADMNSRFESAYAGFMKKAIKIAKDNYSKRAKAPLAFDIAITAISRELRKKLEESAKDGATSTYMKSEEALGVGFGIKDEKAITTLLTLKNGAYDSVKSFTDSQKIGLANTMDEAFNEGLDLRNMVKSMQEYSDAETYKLERIARTESHRFGNQGRIAGYTELEDRRGKKYQYNILNTEDDRTCELCFDVVQGSPYESLNEATAALNHGVIHPSCRCVISRDMDEE